jgi:hypothetical protein
VTPKSRSLVQFGEEWDFNTILMGYEWESKTILMGYELACWLVAQTH